MQSPSKKKKKKLNKCDVGKYLAISHKNIFGNENLTQQAQLNCAVGYHYGVFFTHAAGSQANC